MAQALEILKQYWGFDSFRKGQDLIIDQIIAKNDVLALLPTGGGKSICYQVPGLVLEGTCLVISPLIALMHDQVNQLKRKGINAVTLTSGMSLRELDITLDNVAYGNVKFLYVSPERLKNNLFIERLRKMNINLIAVDEAHCISEWGYDFRPAYLEIAEIRTLCPNTPIIALTATATDEIIDDIQEKLKFSKKNLIKHSFLRDNLIYKTEETQNKLNRIIEFIKGENSSGIVYCSTRKEVKNLCRILVDNGISANFYHGGLESETRNSRQNEWLNNTCKVMVCTNAFGMGIDKPDVRYVLHYSIPETIEAYFQEAGRAGRDEKEAQAVLYFEPADIRKTEQNIELKYPEVEFIKQVYFQLGNFFQIAIGSGKECTYEIDVLEFCDHYSTDLIKTFNALKFLELTGYIVLSENIQRPSQIQIIADKNTLYNYQVKNENLNLIIQFLVRTQMGVFEHLQAINETKIAKHTKISLSEIVKLLEFLHKAEIVNYLPKVNGSQIYFPIERLGQEHLLIPFELLNKRKTIAGKKFEAMKTYLTGQECSNIYLLEYFGEKSEVYCGKCAFCLNKLIIKSSVNQLDIVNYLNSQFKIVETVLISDLISNFNKFPKEETLAVLRNLVDHNQFFIDESNKKILK